MSRARTRPTDSAVSPIIGCFIMVAIAAAASGAIYLWISAPSADAGTSAGSLTLTSSSALLWRGGDQVKTFTIAYATPDLRYGDVKFTLDGVALPYDAASPAGLSSWRVHHAGAILDAEDAIALKIGSGDEVDLVVGGGGASGKVLHIVQPTANTVVLSLTLA
jgi:hypothetical protein